MKLWDRASRSETRILHASPALTGLDLTPASTVAFSRQFDSLQGRRREAKQWLPTDSFMHRNC